MARNKSEKMRPRPRLSGHADWLMEPIRLDALFDVSLDGANCPGNSHYVAWDDPDKRAYDDIDDDDKVECFERWVSYYEDYPGEKKRDKKCAS